MRNGVKWSVLAGVLEACVDRGYQMSDSGQKQINNLPINLSINQPTTKHTDNQINKQSNNKQTNQQT